MLLANGWYKVNHVGSYKQFKHPTRKGRVTVPDPKKDIPTSTLRNIYHQARLYNPVWAHITQYF